MGSAPEDMDVGGDANVHTQSVSVCAQCSMRIADNSAVVVCQGKCKRTMHCCCLWNVTAAEVEAVRGSKNILFVCNACVDLRVESEVGARVPVVPVVDHGKTLNELLRKVDELSSNFELKVKKIVNEVFLQNNKRSVAGAEDKDEPGMRTRLRSSKKRKVDTAESNKESETPTPGVSFADKVKEKPEKETVQPVKPAETNRKPDPVVVIKAKEGQQIGNLREQLRKKVNPKQLNVDRVVQNSNGALVITLKDDASTKILKESVEKSMGDQVEVKVRESMRPSVKLVGLSEEYDEDELKQSLVEQNDAFSALTHFKLRKFYRNEKRKYTPYSAIVELDAATFFKVMEEKELDCDFDTCKVFDGLDVTRCFKCCGFNHKAADCKAEEAICPICSGNHLVKECTATEEKCCNCEKMRKIRKLNLDTGHAAWSTDCPVYQKLKKRRSEQVDFTA